ncbi:hypothetical protein [Tenuifilum thalassicum]|uniref:Uncharacterized protein n=1 Tax=Tenuifilum thalassicum TaxID=2590900 RepID=A0A7D4AW31_9BACT|nr:hypothetical protein [Tenuifilum thalassicum]QKG79034.1 hypothetical protein FHG85_01725 [Tenuifilum thalassicum]
MKNKRLIIILLSIMVILMVPFFAMQVSNEVNWTPSDFLVAAVLLLASGLSIEFALRKIKRRKFRIAIVIAILILLLIVWAELAVGIFGTPLPGS